MNRPLAFRGLGALTMWATLGCQVIDHRTDEPGFAGCPPCQVNGTHVIGPRRTQPSRASASNSGYVSTQFGQWRSFESGRPIELDAGQVLEGLVLSLPRGAVITGRVIDDTGEPVAGAVVWAMRPQFAGGTRWLARIGRPVETDDRGESRLFDLAPGSFYLQTAAAPLGESLPFGSVYYPGTANPDKAERVSVRVGQVRSGVNVVLDPVSRPVWPATLSGTVSDGRRGGPLRDATIRATSFARGGSVSGAVQRFFVSVVDITKRRLVYSTFLGAGVRFQVFPDTDGHLAFIAEAGWSAARTGGSLPHGSSSFTRSGRVYFSREMTTKVWNTGIFGASSGPDG